MVDAVIGVRWGCHHVLLHINYLFADSNTLHIQLIVVKISSGNSWKSAADVLHTMKTVHLPFIAYYCLII